MTTTTTTDVFRPHWNELPQRETVGDSSLANKRIIAIAVDASENSERAVKWAMTHLIDTDRDVVMLMNVRPTLNLYTPALTDLLDHRSVQAMDDHERKQSHEIIRKYMDWMSTLQVPCRGFSLCGDHVGHEITLETKQLQADMLLMGTRGMSGLKRLFLGSTSEYCLHHTECTLILVPQKELHKMLQLVYSGSIPSMDCSVTRLSRFPELSLVQTTDFFYPLVDDPYTQGQITCANVLSDLYAMGITDCDNMLMLLGVSTHLQSPLKEHVVQLIMKGFHDTAHLADTTVTGGQTVKSEWFMMGGVATCVVPHTELIAMDQAEEGDVLVLTKPLGTQIAVNAHVWLKNPDQFKRIDSVVTREDVTDLYHQAVTSMVRLNRQAAILLKHHGVKACTDVTGFGILGHAQALNQLQCKNVDFIIDVLPCLRHAMTINQVVDYALSRGTSAETSGGLLAVLPQDRAFAFIQELSRIDGAPAWIVGRVVAGDKQAQLSKECQWIHV